MVVADKRRVAFEPCRIGPKFWTPVRQLGSRPKMCHGSKLASWPLFEVSVGEDNLLGSPVHLALL